MNSLFGSASPVRSSITESIIWTLDAASGNVISVDAGFEFLFRRSKSELASDPLCWLSSIHQEDKPRIQAAFETRSRVGRYQEEYRVLAEGESVQWVRDRCLCIPDSQPARILRTTDAIPPPKQILAERALHADYDLLFTANPHPSWVFDHQTLQVMEVNEAAVQQYGYTHEEFLGLKVSELRPKDDLERFLTLRTGPVAGYGRAGVWRHVKKSGEEILVEVVSHSVIWKSRPARLVMALDVTERIRAEQALQRSEERYRRIVETAQEGMWVLDTESRIVFVNHRGANMVGYTIEELQGCHASRLLNKSQLPEARARLRNHPQGQPQQFDLQLCRKDGSEIWVLVSSSGLFDDNGDLIGTVAMVTDFTERRRMEQTIQANAAELMRSNLDLQQFAYVISHDLQEPLRSITSYLQLIEKRYSSAFDEDGHDFLNFALRGSQRMAAMIRDLLSYSRIGRLETEHTEIIDSAEALRSALANLETMIRETGAQVSFQNLPHVRANRMLLMQLFQNLISNAIKYRGEEDPVIAISGERVGTDWVIAVQDNGIGIAPAHADRIFGVFKRLHGHEFPGTGIGLAVCKKISLFHGGRIWVESELGKGAKFLFTIPVEPFLPPPPE